MPMTTPPRPEAPTKGEIARLVRYYAAALLDPRSQSSLGARSALLAAFDLLIAERDEARERRQQWQDFCLRHPEILPPDPARDPARNPNRNNDGE